MLDTRRRAQIIARAVEGSSIVLVGAGFISTTIVEALVDCGAKLTIVEMEDRLIPRMMGKDGSDIIRKWCENKAVVITHFSARRKYYDVGRQVKTGYNWTRCVRSGPGHLGDRRGA